MVQITSPLFLHFFWPARLYSCISDSKHIALLQWLQSEGRLDFGDSGNLDSDDSFASMALGICLRLAMEVLTGDHDIYRGAYARHLAEYEPRHGNSMGRT